MKKFFYLLPILTVVLFSCQSVEYLSIDYLEPASISFPKKIRKVGVVNNVNNYADVQFISGDTVRKPYELAHKIDYYRGNGKLAAESLAEAIANENYFDLVVINDSALRQGDIYAREAKLGRTEVEELTSEMGVDLIVALEDVIIKSMRRVLIYDFSLFWGTVDAYVNTSVSLYTPGRDNPMAIVNSTDSIFWETIEENKILAQTFIPDSTLIEESSVFAGIVPVKHILPVWKSSQRFYYTNGSADMRDAAVFVRQESWDKACELWMKVYDKQKKGKKKMEAALNIALYYEMQDKFDEAVTWANTALELANKVEKVTAASETTQNINTADAPNYRAIYYYLMELQKRKDNFSRLNSQMEVIKEE